MKSRLILLTVLGVTACGSTTGVVPIGSGAYMLGKQDGMAYSGSGVKAELYRQAADYCGKQNQDVQPLNSQSQDSGIGKYASAEIQFRCVPKAQ